MSLICYNPSRLTKRLQLSNNSARSASHRGSESGTKAFSSSKSPVFVEKPAPRSTRGRKKSGGRNWSETSDESPFALEPLSSDGEFGRGRSSKSGSPVPGPFRSGRLRPTTPRFLRMASRWSAGRPSERRLRLATTIEFIDQCEMEFFDEEA